MNIGSKILKTITVLFLLIFPLYIIEFYLSATDPYRKLKNLHSDSNIQITRDGWGILNGEIISTWGIPVKLLGRSDLPRLIRYVQIDDNKGKETFRILLLGDSVSWGIGLDEEERYSNILEKLLNENDTSKKYEVLNFSVPGFSTTDERDLLIRIKDRVQPDLIIIGFCRNDPKRGPVASNKKRDEFIRKLNRIYDPVQRALGKIGLMGVSKIIYDFIVKIAESLGVIPDWMTILDMSYNTESADWKEFTGALKDIKMISDSLKLPAPFFVVLNHGLSPNKPLNYNKPDKALLLYSKWLSQAEKTAKELGFVTINMEEEIKNHLQDTPLGVNKLDAHPSAALHRIYAEKIFRTILPVVSKK